MGKLLVCRQIEELKSEGRSEVAAERAERSRPLIQVPSVPQSDTPSSDTAPDS